MYQHSHIRNLGVHLTRGISIKHVRFASKMTYYEMRIIPKCLKVQQILWCQSQYGGTRKYITS